MKALIVSSENKQCSKALKEIGIAYDTASDDYNAIRLCRQNKYSLYLIDINLNKLSGIEFCSVLRTKTNAPVILVGKTHNEAEAVACYGAGADDYISMPFGTLELECKIKALMRRCQNSPFVSLDWLDFDNCTATIDGREIHLSRMEFDLLSVLAASSGHTVSKRALIVEVWGGSSLATDDALKVRINSLRNKIGKNHIQTVRGYGYKLVTD